MSDARTIHAALADSNRLTAREQAIDRQEAHAAVDRMEQRITELERELMDMQATAGRMSLQRDQAQRAVRMLAEACEQYVTNNAGHNTPPERMSDYNLYECMICDAITTKPVRHSSACALADPDVVAVLGRAAP